MLNYEITRSPVHRGHQRRVITDSNSAQISIATIYVASTRFYHYE